MAREKQRIWRGIVEATASPRTRRVATTVSVEPLEDRLLLATVSMPTLPPTDYASVLALDQEALRASAQSSKAAQGDPAPAHRRLPKSQRIQFGGSRYTLSLSGAGGIVASAVPHRGVDITLLGTDQNTQVTVKLSRPTHASRSAFLPIAGINVKTGALGSFQALNTADLNGPISPLVGTVGSLQFDEIGAKATIEVDGTLGGLTVARDVALGPAGRIHVTGDVTGPVSVAGGVNLAGGRISLDRDLLGTTSIGGNLAMSDGGKLAVGRDLNTLQVGGDLTSGSNGAMTVGRNLNSITVNGNIDTSAGGTLAVGGNLNTLMVNGYIRGKLKQDIVVGLNLLDIAVRGGLPDEGSLQSVNLDVGKNIQGVDISQGVFNSLITAGVRIDGGTPNDKFNIGPDGAVAVFDSTITAGVQITNFTISGDVKSDKPTNPAGRPTRIVAGVDKDGNFAVGGNIDNFQITGSLIDAVVAASVQPFGGNGTLTLMPGKAPGDGGFDTYDAPAGTITGAFGTAGNTVITVLNFTAPPFNSTVDPTIDDAVLPGAINASLAPSLTQNPPSLPTKSTVLGGVISTPHGDEADYAGIFAADTRGVFVGTLPK